MPLNIEYKWKETIFDDTTLASKYKCCQCGYITYQTFHCPNDHIWCKSCMNNDNKCNFNGCNNKPISQAIYVDNVKNTLRVCCPNSIENSDTKLMDEVKSEEPMFCDWNGKLNDLIQHLNECQYIKTECALKNIGCDMVTMNKHHMHHHFDTQKLNHFELILNELRKMNSKVATLENEIRTLKNQNIELRNELNAIKTDNVVISDSDDNIPEEKEIEVITKIPDLSFICNAKSIEIKVNNIEVFGDFDQFSVYYRETNQNDWIKEIKIRDNNVGYFKIKNDNVIKPLMDYDIKCEISGIFSEEYTVTTKVIYWNKSKDYHGKNVKFINNHTITCPTAGGNTCICGAHILKNTQFDNIKFKFKINKFCQTSLFGFIQVTTMESLKNRLKNCWNSDYISNNKYCYIISTMDGLMKVYRYIKGKSLEASFFGGNNGIDIPYKIKQADEFIFYIDFQNDYCNVYINNEDEMSRIKMKNKQDNKTFSEIPSKIIPIYQHCAHEKFVDRPSNVTITIMDYKLANPTT